MKNFGNFEFLLINIVWFFSMVHVQSKLTKAAACLEYFTTQEWNFDDTNVRLLNQSLSESDRRDFCFDASLVNWHEFIESYVLGIRRYYQRQLK